jgi:hypothetical protein
VHYPFERADYLLPSNYASRRLGPGACCCFAYIYLFGLTSHLFLRGQQGEVRKKVGLTEGITDYDAARHEALGNNR